MIKIKKTLPNGMKLKKCINKDCERMYQTYKTITEENKLDQVCNNGICAFKARDQAKYNLVGFR